MDPLLEEFLSNPGPIASAICEKDRMDVYDAMKRVFKEEPEMWAEFKAEAASLGLNGNVSTLIRGLEKAQEREAKKSVDFWTVIHPCSGKPPFHKFTKKVVVVINGNDPVPPDEITARIVYALHEANEGTEPAIFQRSGGLVAVHYNGDCDPSLRVLETISLRQLIDRCCMFVRRTVADGVVNNAPTDVSDSVIKKVLMYPEFPFPNLTEITTVPGMRKDGTVCQTPGFDKASGRLSFFSVEDLRLVSDKPSKEELDEAVCLVNKMLAGFPFEEDGSRANAVGMLITPFVRSMHKGLVPLHCVSARTKGTGKSKLCEVCISVRGKDSPEGYAIPEKTEELNKTVQTAVLSGDDCILLDNLDAPLNSGGMCAILTMPTLKFRILGGHREVAIPNQFLFMVTGNNIQVLGDMGRRVQSVNMDAGVADPWNRSFSMELPDWTVENRASVVWALLTLVRSWVVAGSPVADSLGFGKGDTYGKWARVVGSVVSYAGWTGFGSNRALVLNADPEPGEWADFVEHLYQIEGDAWWYASGLSDHIVKAYRTIATGFENPAGAEELIDVLPVSLGKPTDGSLVRRLGNQLAERVGVPFPDCVYKIERRKGTQRRMMYRIASPESEPEKD